MARSTSAHSGALLFVVLAAFALAGCVQSAAPASPTGEPSAAVSTPTEVPTPTVTRAFQGTPAVAGTLRFAATSEDEDLAQVVADVFTAHLPDLKVELVKSSGPASTLRLMGLDKADIALVRDDLSVLASEKEAPFEDVTIRVASLAALYAETVQLVVNADSNIASSRDLVERRVNLPVQESADALLTDEVLRAGAFRARDFDSMAHMGIEQAAKALREGRIDAIITVGPAPIPSLQQGAEQHPVRLLPLTAQWQEAIHKEYPALQPMVLPAGLYKGQDTPVETVGVRVILAVRRDMPEETAYALAQALVEGMDDIKARHPVGGQIALEEITRSVQTPFHSAAVQYYREEGLVR